MSETALYDFLEKFWLTSDHQSTINLINGHCLPDVDFFKDIFLPTQTSDSSKNILPTQTSDSSKNILPTQTSDSSKNILPSQMSDSTESIDPTFSKSSQLEAVIMKYLRGKSVNTIHWIDQTPQLNTPRLNKTFRSNLSSVGLPFLKRNVLPVPEH
jgi:hypothetical protein